MRKPLLIIGLLVAVVYACNQQGKTFNPLARTSKLPSQLFTIDITKDTTLHTQHGALIRIPHGALSGSSTTVQLEVKEAYSIQDMLQAGLTTMSNGQPLSSGGMIYINAVGDNTVRITQKISIATPTPFLDSSMQLYKGEVQADSTINWVNPKAMPANPQLSALDSGNILFQMCASCHAIGKDLTGPDLAHILTRPGPGVYSEGCENIYCFTRYPSVAIAQGGYYRCLKNKYQLVMTPFPKLTDRELDQLYAYIENESNRRHLPVPDNGIRKCRDSCELYTKAVTHWQEVKAELEKETVEMVVIRKRSQAATQPQFPEDGGLPVKVSPMENQSLYYQFKIEDFGWYNIDRLVYGAVDTKPSELKVHIQGTPKQKFNLYLLIPSEKVMVAGGPLKGQEDTYGFHLADGTIPLPQNAKAFIIAMGEQEDQIIFSKIEFLTKEKQTFDLKLNTIAKEAFQQQIASLQLSDLTITASETKNAAALRQAIKELKKVEDLKPKNCDCDCFLDALQPDTSSKLFNEY